MYVVDKLSRERSDACRGRVCSSSDTRRNYLGFPAAAMCGQTSVSTLAKTKQARDDVSDSHSSRWLTFSLYLLHYHVIDLYIRRSWAAERGYLKVIHAE